MNPFREHSLLTPNTTFLNYGSFGACPEPIFKKYQALQLQLERQPVKFIMRDGMELLKQARQRLGAYVGCGADDLVFVTNPSYGINTVARSFPLKSGDEVLATDIEYGALDRTWNYYCRKAGATYVRAKTHFPITTKEKFLEDFWKGYSSKTKAVFISQITSSTGLILPVKEVVAEAKRRGLLAIVDGAHVPGHIELDITALGADIYTGACHKWMMAPKGASFLYVSPEHQQWIDPLVISWGYESDYPSHSQFLDYHQTNGTRDFSAFLTVPACIDYMAEHDWPSVARRCRELVLKNAQRFCDLAGSEPLCPINEEWLGQLYSFRVRTNDPLALYQELINKYHIEIPVMKQGEDCYIRFSIQAYNEQSDLDKLEAALIDIREKSGLWK